jgi:hypothetical protein
VDFVGEDEAVDGEGLAAGDAGGFGGAHEEGIEAAKFLFEEPGCGGMLVAFEGVAADEFGQHIGLVSVCGAHGAHFEEGDGEAAFGQLPGGFGAGESAADYSDAG